MMFKKFSAGKHFFFDWFFSRSFARFARSSIISMFIIFVISYEEEVCGNLMSVQAHR